MTFCEWVGSTTLPQDWFSCAWAGSFGMYVGGTFVGQGPLSLAACLILGVYLALLIDWRALVGPIRRLADDVAEAVARRTADGV